VHRLHLRDQLADADWLAGELGQFGRGARRIVGRGVEARAGSRAAQTDLAQRRAHGIERGGAAGERPGVAGELLPQGGRDRVLQMGAAGLHGVLLAFGQAAEFSRHRMHGSDQARQLGEHGEADRGGNGVVGRLPHVDVVVWIDRLVAAFFAAQCDVGEVGDDFVAVHVVAGAGTGLEAVDHEFVVIFTRENLVAGRDDGIAFFSRQPARLAVGMCCGKLDSHVR